MLWIRFNFIINSKTAKNNKMTRNNSVVINNNTVLILHFNFRHNVDDPLVLKCLISDGNVSQKQKNRIFSHPHWSL